MSRHVKLLFLGLAVIGGYLALIGWFAWADVYNAHFFDKGGLVALYNMSRLAFAVALAWLIYAPGAVILAMVAGFPAVRSLSAGERYALGFFTGAGFWYVLLFAIGFAGGYTRPIAIALTLGVLALSVPHLAACVSDARRLFPAARRRSSGWLLASFAAVAVLFICIKVLYPGDGNDYYNHYFYYYVDVIKNGSLAPNEAWYHFYYSKGWGLYFLGMLLTDPLIPSVVTAVFVFAGALTVALLLQRLVPESQFPLIGATLYLGLLIFTPSPPDLVGAAGWAELAKGHESNAAMFLGMFWSSIRLAEVDTRERRLWLIGALGATAGLVLITTEMGFIAGSFFVALALWGLAARRRDLVAAALACATVAGAELVVVAGINYVLTGIPLDQLILYLWAIVDLHKVARWGVLNDLLTLHIGRTGFVRQSVPFFWAGPRALWQDLRLHLLWPILAFGAVGAGFALFEGRWRGAFGSPARRAFLVALVAFLFSVAPTVMALGTGPLQGQSVYRLTSFAFGPTLCAVVLFGAVFPVRTRAYGWIAGGLIAAVVLSGQGGKHGRMMLAGIPMLTGDAVSFAAGGMSIEDAYRHPGWPGRLPWGGIYPAMEQVWKIIGRGTPVYSFNLHSYCMLPDCHVLHWHDTRTVPDFETVLFGTPDEAVAAVKRAGIDYFFYSTELADLPAGISTPIVLSPAFSPDGIARHLGIVWSDGTSYLLTWRDKAERPLDESFISVYRRQVAASLIVAGFPLDQWRSVFAHFKAYGLHPYRLPWCVVCPGVPAD